MNSRGRRTQRRAEERREAKAFQRKMLETQRSYRAKRKRLTDGG